MSESKDAAPPQLIERVELGLVAGSCLFALLLMDLAGFYVVFGGIRNYVDSNGFGQLANLIDRTNGLLVLIMLNQVLVLGVLAGLRRTFEIKR